MTVGVLVITHDQIGRALVDAAVSTLGCSPMATAVLAISLNADPDTLCQRAVQLVAGLDRGDGVLVLTDMYGSTPSNIACKLKGERVRVVAGVNLPMLIRVLNYSRLSLTELVDKALSGGRDGIMSCQQWGSPVS